MPRFPRWWRRASQQTRSRWPPIRHFRPRLEFLEERRLLTAGATFTDVQPSLDLSITTGQNLAIFSTGTAYDLALSSGTWTGSDTANVTGNGSATLVVTSAGLSAFTTAVNITDPSSTGGDGITFNTSQASGYFNTFSITLANASAVSALAFNGSTSFENSASLAAAVNGSVVINSGASLASFAGSIALEATGTNAALTAGGEVISQSGAITLEATGDATISSGITINAGSGPITLAADTTASGAGDDGIGTLAINAGATVTTTGTITLRGADVNIDTSSDPAVVGATRSLGTTASATLTGLNTPAALAFDSSGNLYVANATNNAVSEFAPGGTTPIATYSDGVDGPQALAFDSSGDLYVANFQGFTVSEFAPGGTTPIATYSTNVSSPDALAFDSSGNLYVAVFSESGSTVEKFSPGNTTPIATYSAGVSDPRALAFDSSGNLYVANEGSNTVSEFAPGSTTPSITYSAVVGIDSPRALAFDSSGNLYVANGNNSTVEEFAPGSTTASATYSGGLSHPQALAFDSSGNLYVADYGNNTVVEFAPGNTTPIATYSAGVSDPRALAFDSSGGLYVANNVGETVERFAPASTTPAAAGVVIQSSVESRPILVGGTNSSPVPGINLTSAELAQVYTTSTGTVTIGDDQQTGNITFSTAAPTTTAGAGLVVVQAAAGAGQVILDDGAGSGTALHGNGGSISITAGTDGITALAASNDAAEISTTGATVTLLTAGPIGTGTNRIQFADNANTAQQVVSIGSITIQPASVYLDGLGSLTLDNIIAYGPSSTIDVTARTNLVVASGGTINAGSGPIMLGADLTPAETGDDGVGTLAINSGATVTTTGTITLRGADVNIDTSSDPAIVGAPRQLSTTPSYTVAAGLDNPNALAFDSSGDLYVASSSGTTVLKFVPGNGTPIAVLAGLDAPDALVFDAFGNLFVANDTTAGTVSEFAPGSITPTATLTGLDDPSALAFENGNLFVANEGGTTVSEFAPGSTTPTATLTGLSGPSALAFDSKGDLFVANETANTVSEFTPGGTAPIATLTGLDKPDALVFDSTGNLYVANLAAGTVSRFSPNTTSPAATLTGLLDPTSLVVDSNNDLYVGTSSPTNNVIDWFLPNSTTPSPSKNLLGIPTALAISPSGNIFFTGGAIASSLNSSVIYQGINSASSLAFDSNGDLYVANEEGFTVSEFGPGGTTFEPTLTGIVHPTAMAFSPSGTLYVADINYGTIYEFAPGSTTPTATITGVKDADLLAFDPMGDLYVGSIYTSTISEFTPDGALIGSLTGVSEPSAMAINSSGDLFVTNFNVSDPAESTVNEYAPRGMKPIATLSGLNDPWGLAIDTSGNLYVGNGGGDTISEFAPGALTATAVLSGVAYPTHLVFDASGDLYVTDQQGVSEFAPGALVPEATITGIANPWGIAVAPSDSLYVIDESSNSVVKFEHSALPATASGVVIQSSVESRPMLVGGTNSSPVAGINLTSAELAQIYTTSTGTVTIGDGQQTGNITFSAATPATTAGAGLVVVQEAAGAGQVILDDGAGGGTALNGNGGSISITAGTGGITALAASNSTAEISTTGSTVTLLTAGPIGTSSNRIQFADNSNTAQQVVSIGSTTIQPASVYLDSLGSLTLDDVSAYGPSPKIDVTARTNLVVASGGTINAGSGPILLGADLTPAETGDDGIGTLSISAGATVTTTGTITLRGADVNIDTSSNPAVVGATRSLGTTASATYSAELSAPQALALDSSGNLYVASSLDNSVSEFAAGSTTLIATYSAGVSAPDALAFDSSGNLYVANYLNNTVEKFAPGSTIASATYSAGVKVPDALAVDFSGNLYVANYGNGTVEEFAPGSTTASATCSVGVDNPTSLAFDASGNLYVANFANSTVSKFAPGSTTADATYSAGVTFPQALAVDSSGNLYVANSGNNTVEKFAPGSTAASATYSAGVSYPDALAFDSNGNLYVANANANAKTVERFAPGSTTASATYSAGVSYPMALAFDSSGNLYVANDGNATVEKFSPVGTVPTAAGVVIQSSVESRPMLVGGTNGSPVAGINLTSAELAQIFTTSTGTVTIGDSQQTGNITFTTATPATTAGAALDVVQSAVGAGQIILDEGGSGGTALNGNGGTVTLTAGTAGIQTTLFSGGLPLSTAGFSASGSLHVTLGFAPAAGTQLTIIDNTAATGNLINGSFSNLAQAGTFTTNYFGTPDTFQVDYDDGGSLVLTTLSSVSNQLMDPNFSAAAIEGGWQYAPGGSPWIFNSTAGVTGNGSAITAGNSAAPQGSQVGFIQFTGALSQAVILTAGNYTLEFVAAQRENYNHGGQALQLLVDGMPVGSAITPVGNTYAEYNTVTFFVAAGTHTITIAGTNPQGGDNTALVDEVSLQAVIPPQIVDPDFSDVVMGTGQWQYAPSGSPWTFTGTAGVTGNDSAITAGNPAAPQGSQAGFIQFAGSIGQTLDLLAGTYTLDFLAAQRGNYNHGGQALQVLVDGTAVGAAIMPSGSNYTNYQSIAFTVAAGTHTIAVAGLNPSGGDNTALVDDVSVQSTTVGQFADPDFGAAAVGAGQWQYAPSGSPWTFVGTAGVSGNDSAITSGNPAAPEGSQVGFIQFTGSVSQAMSLAAGSYTIEFVAAQRENYNHGGQTLQVLVDGMPVDSGITPAGSNYAAYSTATFTAAAGTHTITIAGLNPSGGDNTALIDDVSVQPTVTGQLADPDFSAAAVGAGQWQYAPGGSPWAFIGTSGVSGNGSAITAGNPAAPEGSQVSFIQDAGSVSQTVSLSAGTYTLDFEAVQRENYNHGGQSLQVLVDGTAVGGSITPTGSNYALYSSTNFTVAAGSHTITIEGLNPLGGDNTALTDAVMLSWV